MASLTSIRYISTLEERIAFLEARVPGHDKDHFDTGFEVLQIPPSTGTGEVSSTIQPQQASWHDSQRSSVSEDPELDEKTSLVDGVAYLSLCASGTTNTTHEPYYVGSTSGAAIARVIQSSIYRGPSSRSVLQSVTNRIDQDREASTSPVTASSVCPDEPRTELPKKEQARMLFDTFFERIHTRWPLLDRAIYEKLFQKQHVQGALTITERSILHLIYAITARFLSLTKQSCGVDDQVSSNNIFYNIELKDARHSSMQRQSRWLTY
jgi:hypothetical protein